MSNYTEIFDSIIFTLSQFAQSDKPLGVKELQFRLGGSKRTAQRITKELSESGWLDFKKDGCSNLYFATEKTKQLFGDAVKIYNNHGLKDLRDKLNGSIQHSEDVELLQEQWNQLHSDMESQIAEDEGNWVGFGDE